MLVWKAFLSQLIGLLILLSLSFIQEVWMAKCYPDVYSTDCFYTILKYILLLYAVYKTLEKIETKRRTLWMMCIVQMNVFKIENVVVWIKIFTTVWSGRPIEQYENILPPERLGFLFFILYFYLLPDNNISHLWTFQVNIMFHSNGKNIVPGKQILLFRGIQVLLNIYKHCIYTYICRRIFNLINIDIYYFYEVFKVSCANRNQSTVWFNDCVDFYSFNVNELLI